MVVGYRMSDELFRALPRKTKKCCVRMTVVPMRFVSFVQAYEARPEWAHVRRLYVVRLKLKQSTAWLSKESARLHEEWNLSDRIVCWSSWCVKCLVEEGVPEEKCVVIPPMFQPSEAYAAVSPDFDSDTLTVVFLGTLCIRKGTHDLIEAVAEVAKTAPVRLVLAGRIS